MRTFFGTLREKDRRRYAAVEAAKFGPGGPAYISRVLGIDPSTIRRLFCHLSRACRGGVFSSVELVKSLMLKTRTRTTGLSVVVDIVQTAYQTGRKLTDEVKQSLELIRDDSLPILNYRILPRPAQK